MSLLGYITIYIDKVPIWLERSLLQNTVPNGEVRSDMNDKTLEDSIWSTPRLELISDSGRIAGAIAPGTDEGGTSAASGAD
jgi:hypothetical protein